MPAMARRLSFTSEALAAGSFPPPAEVCEPIINVPCVVTQLPARQRLVAAMKQLLDLHPRFAMSPAEGEGCCASWKWTEAPMAVEDVEAHIKTHAKMDGWESAWDAAFQASERPIDLPRSCAWWEVHLIPVQGTEKAIVMLRIHHVIGDGIGLASALRVILTDASGNPVGAGKKFERRPAKATCRSPLGILWDLGVAMTLPSIGADVPLPNLQGDRPLRYGPRQFANVAPIPVARVKAVARSVGATFNDVVLAAVAGAVASACQPPEKGMVRALMPFAAPRSSESRGGVLRNLWSFVSVKLPVTGRHTGIERIRAVKKETDMLKASLQAQFLLFLTNYVVSMAPRFVSRQITYDTFSRHSFVVTNVPGPAEPVHLAGAEVLETHLLFPNLIPQISFLSYNDVVYCNIIAHGKASEVAANIEREIVTMEREMVESGVRV